MKTYYLFIIGIQESLFKIDCEDINIAIKEFIINKKEYIKEDAYINWYNEGCFINQSGIRKLNKKEIKILRSFKNE